MNFTVTDEQRVVPHRRVDNFDDESYASGRRSELGRLSAFLHSLWMYNLGLIAGFLAALVSAAVFGTVFSGIAAFVYETWVFYAGDPAGHAYESGFNFRYHLAKCAMFTGAAFAATFSFCVACLRVFPNKGQIQSVVVLELVALPGIFAIAGDARGTDDYTLMFAGCGVLLSIAVLALRFPHWVYLTRRNFGE